MTAFLHDDFMVDMQETPKRMPVSQCALDESPEMLFAHLTREPTGLLQPSLGSCRPSTALKHRKFSPQDSLVSAMREGCWAATHACLRGSLSSRQTARAIAHTPELAVFGPRDNLGCTGCFGDIALTPRGAYGWASTHPTITGSCSGKRPGPWHQPSKIPRFDGNFFRM